MELGRAERRRLAQLCVSVALFLAVFVGKGILPDGLAERTEQLRAILHTDTDFSAAFSRAGEAIGSGESVLDTLGDFCVSVFGAGGLMPEEETPKDMAEAETGMAFREGKARLTEGTGIPVRTLAYRPQEETEPEKTGEEEPPPEETPAVLPVGAVIQASAYEGQPLPEHVSMAWLSLGELDFQDPLEGTLTSDFSYRLHPVEQVVKFHYGVDLASESETPIRAFADGTVEFTGESDGYGIYLQLDHGNGVKTFYAHCKGVAVRRGETVSKGETIAYVGETGNATGPHLHFQIKVNDVWLDPLYYLSAGA